MRLSIICIVSIVILTGAIGSKDPIEEEDVGAHVEYEEHHNEKRELHNEEPFEEHIHVKQNYEESEQERVRRSTDYTRIPRHVHQYQVHEDTDDNSVPTSPPYEQMLAASAEHYHRAYAAPGAPTAARYMNPEVSGHPLQHVIRPVSSNNPNVFTYRNPGIPNREFIPTDKDKYVNVIAHRPILTFAHPPPLASVNIQRAQPLVSEAPKLELFSKFPKEVPITLAPTKDVYVSPVNVASVNVAPVKPIDAAVVGPAPVSSEPVSAPLKQLDGEDQSEAAGHIHKHRTHVLVHGGGHGGHAGHHANRGGKHVKGFKQDHHLEKGAKGFKKDELHKKQYENAEGLKKKHRDHADHKGSHAEEAHGHKGSHFDEKKGHKKGHKTKGYHNKYHKDEFHKEHKFYDDYHKSGEHHRYGKFNAKHASNESGKKKAHHANHGHDFVEHGKKGYSNKGHVDSDHKGYKGKHGHEEHKEHHSHHGKKGGKDGGSEWGYSKKA